LGCGRALADLTYFALLISGSKVEPSCAHDGQSFPGDANVATAVGIVIYSVAYQGGKADKLASRLLSDPHSVKIVAADNNFSIPTADLGKAFAVDEQCCPLWWAMP
jgi:hypothetical protein